MFKPGIDTPKRRSLLAKLRLASWRGRLAWVAGLLLTVVAVCWVLMRMTPSWYRPLDPDDQGVQDASGRAWTLLSTDLHTAAERVPLGEQRWSITQDEVNSFLATNTAVLRTGEGRGGAQMDPARNPVFDPFVVFGEGEVTVCARFTKLPSRDAQGGVGSATFTVGMVSGPDGAPMGLVKLKRVWAGYLPVPQAVVESRVRAMMPALQEAVRHAAQFQLGLRDMDKADPILQLITQSVVEGKPFPLHFKVDREFIVKELTVESGVFAMVLAPVKPGVVAPRPLPVGSAWPPTRPFPATQN